MALPGTSGSTMESVAPKIDPEKSTLLHGFSAIGKTPVHPLQHSEQTYKDRMDQMNYAMLRKTQGIHAPLRILMEKDAASRVGRLPFLPSSNLMRDVIEGRDEDITFDDILNDPSQPEVMTVPYLMMDQEKKSSSNIFERI